MKKLSQIFALLIVLTMLLAACAPTEVVKTVVVTQIVEGQAVEKIITATPAPTKDVSQEPVSLRFTTWTGNEGQLKLLNEIAAAYQAQHPNVTIKFETIAFDEYPTKLTVQLAGGNPPDMGWVVETVSAQWIKAGVLEDLTPTLKAYPGYNLEDFSAGPLSGWTRDQSIYAVPFSTSPFFVLYNLDLFAKAGEANPAELIAKGEWTWENLAKAAKNITEKNEKGTYGYNGAEGGNLYASMGSITPFVWANGGNLWTPDYATCQLDTPETVKGLSFIQSMVVNDKSVVPPGETVSFTTGKVGMALGQISRVGPLKDAAFKWSIAPLPAGPNGVKPTVGQAAIGVFKSGPNKAAAMDFLAFMTNEENVTKLAQFWPPARKSVLATDAVSKNYPSIDPVVFQQTITDSINNGQIIPSHPDFSKLELTIRPFFDKMWVKDADVQALMTEACKTAAPYFKK
jgi:multiple sugar transport system substrate-binding protein